MCQFCPLKLKGSFSVVGTLLLFFSEIHNTHNVELLNVIPGGTCVNTNLDAVKSDDTISYNQSATVRGSITFYQLECARDGEECIK